MAYIGRNLEQFSNVEKLDVITPATATGAGPYNLTQNSTAFTPVNANSLVISIDGVVQYGNFTVNEATVTFDAALSDANTCDFIYQMGIGLISTPADDTVSTAKLEDGAVTGAKVNSTFDVSAKTVTLPASVSGLGTGITNAQLAGSIDVTSKITGVVPTANLGTGTASASTYLAGDQTYKALSEYDDNTVQSNIALLGFKVATNGSLVKYNLQDQIIDEYEDASGIDASASTNEILTAGSYNGGTVPTITHNADTTGTDGNYTWYKYTSTGSVTYTSNVTQDYDFLVIAGGGSGGSGNSAGGGGGAGGYRNSYASEATGGGGSNEAALSFIGDTTYTITVGTGGASVTGINNGNNGVASSITGSDITDITTVGGGGGGNPSGSTGQTGGSGGGQGGVSSTAPGAGTANQGYSGGTTISAQWSGAGGGGAGQAGINVATSGNNQSTAGGAGLQSSIDGTPTYRAGGGGGAGDATSLVSQAGGTGGGGAAQANGVAGTANTGSGGGSGWTSSGAGGTGIVIIRRSTTNAVDLTLQSTDTTAMAEADNADMVMLMENSSGTATLNTDIKGYISRDSGTTFTQGTLVDEGTWGTNKKILAFHDLDISGQPSGTDMCYKITTHNQSAGSKETKIHATSIGWR